MEREKAILIATESTRQRWALGVRKPRMPGKACLCFGQYLPFSTKKEIKTSYTFLSCNSSIVHCFYNLEEGLCESCSLHELPVPYTFPGLPESTSPLFLQEGKWEGNRNTRDHTHRFLSGSLVCCSSLQFSF